jgi:regulatory protein
MGSVEFYRACLNKAMNVCSRKECAASEIEDKLISWGAVEADVKKIIKALTEEQYIDDKRYAEAFARDKLRYNKWGRIKIAMHLRQKKVDPQLIKNALINIDEDEYREILGKLISNHRKSVKARSQYEFRAKMYRFALSKGFESSVISEIIKMDE